MAILITLLCLFGALIITFLVYGFSLPAKWSIQASELVGMDQANLHAYLNEIRNWEEWTIWNKENASKFEFSYEGPMSGPGATMIWKTPKQTGRTQIRSLKDTQMIGLLFSFGNSQHSIESNIELRPRGPETEVVWSASGNAGDQPARRIMAKMFMPYMRKDFETSLKRLRARMHSRPEPIQ
jgi:hypothetical protein